MTLQPSSPTGLRATGSSSPSRSKNLAMDTLNLEGLQPIEITQNRQRNVWKSLEQNSRDLERLGENLELAEAPERRRLPFVETEAQRARPRSPQNLLSDLPREPRLTRGINYIR
jgi:hypothetical protein